jgi:hypothetical protein
LSLFGQTGLFFSPGILCRAAALEEAAPWGGYMTYACGHKTHGGFFMKKSKLFLAGMAALLLSFGLVLAGCDNGSSGGGGPGLGALVGEWLKTDGKTISISDSHGEVSAECRLSSTGETITGGTLTSYDGTTVQIEVWGSSDVISFTAALTDTTLTIGGLTGNYTIFNGLYTKQP